MPKMRSELQCFQRACQNERLQLRPLPQESGLTNHSSKLGWGRALQRLRIQTRVDKRPNGARKVMLPSGSCRMVEITGDLLLEAVLCQLRKDLVHSVLHLYRRLPTAHLDDHAANAPHIGLRRQRSS